MTTSDIHQKKNSAAKLTLWVGVLILLIKFYAWWITDSAAIYSDALESIVNVVTAITGWIALRISAKPADKDHPYGHGKVEYFSAGLEGVLITIAGSLIIYESVQAFIYGLPLQEINIGLGLICLTALINGGLSWYLIRTGKKTRSAALIASGHHVGSDALTTVGVFVGLFIVKFTQISWIDPVLALLVAVHIIYQGLKLVKAAGMRLMDSADETALEQISHCLVTHRKDEWIAPHKLRAWRAGSQLYVDFHMIMPWYLSLKETHDDEHFIKSTFSTALNESVELIIHTEPCFPQACSYCKMKTCSYRNEPQSQDVIWTKEYLMDIPVIPKPD
ncbi:cation transporter [bacterium]|nr:MAG: cation transporter [bacterium]